MLSVQILRHDGYLSCCRFLDEATILTTSGDRTCRLWDIERNEDIVTFMDHAGDVMGVAISPLNPQAFVTGECSFVRLNT